MKQISTYTLTFLVALIALASCGGEGSIKGVWEIDDYIIEKESEADLTIVNEAKTLLKENNNNMMFFADSIAGALMPNGDTLTQFPYRIEGDKLLLGDAGSSFKLKDNNTLHLYDPNVDLIVQFKRVK